MFNRRIRVIAARWWDVILYGLVAGAACFLIEPILTRSCASAVEAISGLPLNSLLAAAAIITMSLAWYAGHGRWGGLLGWKHLHTYPPLWVAMITGLATLLLLRADFRNSTLFLSALLLILLVRLGVALWIGRLRSASSSHKP